MFGKKSTNIDLDKSNDLPTKSMDLTPVSEQDSINESAKYIFYDNKKKFTRKLEIYISLKNYDKKFLLVIDFDSSYEELIEQIKRYLKTFAEFKSISKLSPEGLYKISNNVKTDLPKEGKVKDNINSGDIIFCNLNTDEFWIKIYFNLMTYNFKKIIKTEYKLKKKMKYKKFKLMLMKGGINFFIDNIKKNNLNDFNYYLKFFEFKIKKHTMIITHNIHNKHKNKMPIDKIINYTSEVIVKMHFGVFEKLIHENLKLSNFENSNILRFNEYAELTFVDLMNEKKYLPEFKTIKEIANDFLDEQKKINNKNFLFYSRRKTRSQKNKIFFSRKNNNNLLENKRINELKEEDEEKDGPISHSFRNVRLEEKYRNKSIKSRKRKSYMDNIEIIEDEEDPNININDIKNDSNDYEIPKKKKKKIKNMIIISRKMLKEEKLKKRFQKLGANDFDKIKDLSKGFSKGKKNISFSNKNIMVYNNMKNILNISDDENKKTKIDNSQDSFSEYNINVDNEIKPKTFTENKGFLIFGESKKNKSGGGLDEILLDDSPKENLIFKDKYKTSVSAKKNNVLKGMNRSSNPLNTEPYFDDRASSGFDEDNKSDLNTDKALKFQKLEKVPSFKINTKRAFFSAFRRRNKNINICDDLKSQFDSENFIESIRNRFNNFSDKYTFEKIKMPQIKEIEYLEKEHNFLINQKKDKQNLNIKLGNRYHVHIFMILLLILLSAILLFINLDFLSIYLGM